MLNWPTLGWPQMLPGTGPPWQQHAPLIPCAACDFLMYNVFFQALHPAPLCCSTDPIPVPFPVATLPTAVYPCCPLALKLGMHRCLHNDFHR